MTKRIIIVAAVAVLGLVAWPAQAELYTLTLKNGTTFETRHQPKEAPWDPNTVLIINDIGMKMGIALADIAELNIMSETKGFGTAIDSVTLDLGIMPNDLPTEDGMPDDDGREMSAFERVMSQDFNQQQFVDPSNAGGGIPVFGVGGTGTGIIGEPQTAGNGN